MIGKDAPGTRYYYDTRYLLLRTKRSIFYVSPGVRCQVTILCRVRSCAHELFFASPSTCRKKKWPRQRRSQLKFPDFCPCLRYFSKKQTKHFVHQVRGILYTRTKYYLLCTVQYVRRADRDRSWSLCVSCGLCVVCFVIRSTSYILAYENHSVYGKHLFLHLSVCGVYFWLLRIYLCFEVLDSRWWMSD